MTDVASLKIAIDSKEAGKATKDLDGLTGAGARAEKSASQMSSAFSGLSRVVAGIGFLGLAREVIQMTDRYTKLTAQLKIATQNQEQYAAAMMNVRRISIIAQADINSISALYARLSNALRDVGITQKQVADISEVVALALKVNGASAAEASSAMLQLSQAFSSGVLRGEEFRALMEAAPNLMRALARSMNIPFGELRGLAEQGLLTGDVLTKAFTDQKLLAGLREQGESVQTISGAYQTLKNSVMEFTGVLNESAGSTSASTAVLNALANSVQRMVTKVTTLKMIAAEAWKALAGDTSGKQVVTGDIKRPAPAYKEPDYDMLFVTKRFEELNKQLKEGSIPLAKYREGIIKMYEALSGEKKVKDKKPFDPEGDFWFAVDDAAMKNQKANNEKYLDDLVKAEEKANAEIRKSALSAQQIYADLDPLYEAGLRWEKYTELVKEKHLDLETAAKHYAQSFGETTDQMTEFAKRAGENIQDAFAEFLFDPFKGGVQGMLDGFTMMLRKMAAEALASQILGSIGAWGKTGGGAGTTIGGIAAAVFGKSFDGGGFTGAGSRSGGMDGKGGFPAMLHPNETVIDHSKGQSASRSVTVINNFSISQPTDRRTQEQIAAMAGASIQSAMMRGA